MNLGTDLKGAMYGLITTYLKQLYSFLIFCIFLFRFCVSGSIQLHRLFTYNLVFQHKVNIKK